MSEFDYSKTRESGKVKNFFVWHMNRFLVKILFRVTFVGFEKMPQEGSYIIAANHVNKLDPMIISTQIKRPIHFMAKKSLFQNSILAKFLSGLNAFPVDRHKFDRRPIKYAKALLDEGRLVGIFPEGTRSRAQFAAPQEAKSGTAMIAREAKAGILPISIYCPVGEKTFAKMTVRCGDFIPYESFGFSEKSVSSELKAASERVMNEIKAMWEEGY